MSQTPSSIKVKAGEYEFSFSPEELEAVSITTAGNQRYHLLEEHQSATVRLLDADQSGKKQQLEVEGESFAVEIRDALDQVVEQMGYSSGVQKQVKQIKAPMPGLILEISVEEGMELEEGAKLLILVAMKMENSITIGSAAKIKTVHVKVGQAVEKGQLLIDLH